MDANVSICIFVFNFTSRLFWFTKLKGLIILIISDLLFVFFANQF
jgi:hypothetical protein